MEPSKRERIILYGVVPVVSAIVGAVGTVLATRFFGAGDGSDAINAILSAPGIDASAKAKLVELVNANDKQFYDLMRSMFGICSLLIGAMIGSGFFRRP
jgi:RsiW-degrading membrane proteinase PrsW (M82 family)